MRKSFEIVPDFLFNASKFLKELIAISAMARPSTPVDASDNGKVEILRPLQLSAFCFSKGENLFADTQSI
jgi:hypothetical protein